MTNEELCERTRLELNKKLEGVSCIKKLQLKPSLSIPTHQHMLMLLEPPRYASCTLEMPAEELLNDALLEGIADYIKKGLAP